MQNMNLMRHLMDRYDHYDDEHRNRLDETFQEHLGMSFIDAIQDNGGCYTSTEFHLSPQVVAAMLLMVVDVEAVESWFTKEEINNGA